jgi:hypothetical protein
MVWLQEPQHRHRQLNGVGMQVIEIVLYTQIVSKFHTSESVLKCVDPFFLKLA